MKSHTLKIACIQCAAWEKKYLRHALSAYQVTFFDAINTPNDYAKLKKFDVISPFINTQFTAAILSRLPRLKCICTRSTGFDHIDIAAAKKKHVIVANVPRYGANTVAEHTFALILSLSRHIYESINRTKRSDFDLQGLCGFDLQGKTIGIIGTGSIGTHVVRIANGFYMHVLMHDTYQKPELVKKYHGQYVSLTKLLRTADIVTLHVPYTKKTHHLINARNIKYMKKGSYLINTARGGLVDTKALVRALTSGQLAGAGLDVLEEEGLIKEEAQLLNTATSADTLHTLLHDHILLKMDNVIVTPHNAFNSQEALRRILDTTVENVKSFAQGRPGNVVNR